MECRRAWLGSVPEMQCSALVQYNNIYLSYYLPVNLLSSVLSILHIYHIVALRDRPASLVAQVHLHS